MTDRLVQPVAADNFMHTQPEMIPQAQTIAARPAVNILDLIRNTQIAVEVANFKRWGTAKRSQ